MRRERRAFLTAGRSPSLLPTESELELAVKDLLRVRAGSPEDLARMFARLWNFLVSKSLRATGLGAPSLKVLPEITIILGCGNEIHAIPDFWGAARRAMTSIVLSERPDRHSPTAKRRGSNLLKAVFRARFKAQRIEKRCGPMGAYGSKASRRNSATRFSIERRTATSQK